MAEVNAGQSMFDAWTRQMDEGAKAWARMVGQMGAAAQPEAFDPMRLWKPFMDQATEAWASALRQGVPPGDLTTQWKTFLDQWIATWDKTFAQAMESEAFAKALGQYLDQWLAVMAPMRKAMAGSTEAMLQASGLPSREQVVGVSRQLMDVDDRIEDVEQRLAARLARIEEALDARAHPPARPSRPGRQRSR